MVDSTLLEILRCPDSRQELQLASSELISQLNAKIAAGSVKNCAGRNIPGPLAEALVTKDGKRLYPVIDNIPVMLIDESVQLNP